MASSSSTLIKRYHVFPSFHGPDVRQKFLSHLHNHFESKGITAFKDQEIERGQRIGPELVQAIRESRISIVILSKQYASSAWCLDELVEIFDCKKTWGQEVIPIFYEVDPSDVRTQSGDFGIAFKNTCEGKTEEEKLRWSQVLNDVGNIAGVHTLDWVEESKMIDNIVVDVSQKLNVTPSNYFDEMVGMEAHMENVNICLRLECNEVMMIGIQGPAGIGKTTIARALFDQLSVDFQLKCFMSNLKENYGRDVVYDHGLKLCLQNQLLSTILNQKFLKIHHLGSIKEWLQNQRVLIFLDDVEDLEQLDALAKEKTWFGPGSRIIVITEDKKILKSHGIDNIYHVKYPSEKESLEILCLSAFKKSSVCDGFEDIAKKLVSLCGNLPLGLQVVGLSLRGENKYEWERQLTNVEFDVEHKIWNALKMGYNKLSQKNKSLFLHIAYFFNNQVIDHVETMLASSNLDVENGMKTLEDKSLVYKSSTGWITMHCLLQKLARKIVNEQSNDPGLRQFLEQAEEIQDVLANNTRYHAFPSFHGPDVRQKFLSHLHNHFESKGITAFKDQEIERGQRIGPELVQAIRESRISIVILSKQYASSAWCLDELVEIFDCKKTWGQEVIPIFYEVDPSDVRTQSGDFGIAFKNTCEGKTEEEKLRWSQVLNDVGNIAGVHTLDWVEESKMIDNIVVDVSQKLNRYHVFPSFHGPDVRQKFLSHLHNHFESKGITAFKDQEIERGQRIGPELVQAIRESRISIVILSKQYASSAWCLDELVEIFDCKKTWGQEVIPIFYEVDPSDVRTQSGDFGIAFKNTCEGKTEEEKLRWSQVLNDVGNIAG
ncbi:unnamed protein product, partial [Cochlearia groenlandica]